MFTGITWLLLAYEIGITFDKLNSQLSQFTFAWLLSGEEKNYIMAKMVNDTVYRKGVEALINMRKSELVDKINQTNEIQQEIVKREGGSINLGEQFKAQIEEALRNTYTNTILKKDDIVKETNDKLDLANIDFQERRDRIIEWITKSRENGLIQDNRTDIERQIRTTLQQENSKLLLENAKEDGSILFCCSHLQDCADDHAPYQDNLFIARNYQTTTYYLKHKEAIDSLLESKKWTYLEDAIDGTIKYRYTLKNGEIRERGLWLSTRWNCRHRFIPITLEQAKDLNKTRKDMPNMWTGNYTPVKYEALKKQRALERYLRDIKTYQAELKEALKWTSNANMIKSKIQECKTQISQINKELDDLCNAFNLPRVRNREQIQDLTYTLGA